MAVTHLAAQTGAAFTTRIQIDTSRNLVLHWPSQGGLRYRVEFSANLINWTGVPGSFIGTGDEITPLVCAADATEPASRFCRVSAAADTGMDVPLSTGVLQNTGASVIPQVGVSYHWTITSGDFTESDGASRIHFVASTPGHRLDRLHTHRCERERRRHPHLKCHRHG